MPWMAGSRRDYDVIVLGGGSAGLAATAMAGVLGKDSVARSARLGRRVYVDGLYSEQVAGRCLLLACNIG
jgi:pyruvate/2-oxoglutarate dehydrogenase complex dihydrolipoamide dehydrogenase (E3) component